LKLWSTLQWQASLTSLVLKMGSLVHQLLILLDLDRTFGGRSDDDSGSWHAKWKEDSEQSFQRLQFECPTVNSQSVQTRRKRWCCEYSRNVNSLRCFEYWNKEIQLKSRRLTSDVTHVKGLARLSLSRACGNKVVNFILINILFF
jgi:hypothetical protein